MTRGFYSKPFLSTMANKDYPCGRGVGFVDFDPSIRKVLETIRRRATEGISASDILPMLGGSRSSAEKRFRAATARHGMTLSAWRKSHLG